MQVQISLMQFFFLAGAGKGSHTLKVAVQIFTQSTVGGD